MNISVKEDRDRLKIFKKYGYDIPKARKFVLMKSKISGGKILEIGTGRGHMAVALAKKGLRIVSIDLDRNAQKIARLNLKSINLDKAVLLKNMDAQRLRYQDNYFDYVISVNFMHHSRNPIKCLKEMIRVAKNKLILADLNKRGERIMERVHALDGHVHAPSKISMKGVKEYLKKAGLIVKVYSDACQTLIIARKEARG